MLLHSRGLHQFFQQVQVSRSLCIQSHNSLLTNTPAPLECIQSIFSTFKYTVGLQLAQCNCSVHTYSLVLAESVRDGCDAMPFAAVGYMQCGSYGGAPPSMACAAGSHHCHRSTPLQFPVSAGVQPVMCQPRHAQHCPGPGSWPPVTVFGQLAGEGAPAETQRLCQVRKLEGFQGVLCRTDTAVALLINEAYWELAAYQWVLLGGNCVSDGLCH